MEHSRTERSALRTSWKTLSPEAVADLAFFDSYTTAEFERLKLGVIPKEMEDKWFICFEDSWLYFHRSWTGSAIFGVQFRSSEGGASVMTSWVSRYIQDTRGAGTEYERALLRFLIDALLLGKHATFPVPDDLIADVHARLYQHHVVGRAYPEVPFPANRPDTGTIRTHSWWTHFSKWLRWLC
jgi:hypothetical protein